MNEKRGILAMSSWQMPRMSLREGGMGRKLVIMYTKSPSEEGRLFSDTGLESGCLPNLTFGSPEGELREFDDGFCLTTRE